MFINSCKILYEASSDDWIFPAQAKRHNSTLWWNIDSRARPLACIDWIEICRNSTTCTSPDMDDPEAELTYDFTRFALNKSTAFHAIEFRGATGLDAQYKIQGDTSLPLSSDPTQWVVESWSLFNTSLSRIQYDAFDIANGTNGDDQAMYVEKMPPRVRGKMCGLFTFQPPKGYKNVRLVPMFLFGILLPFIVWLMALETKTEFSEEKKRSGWFHGMKLIVLEKTSYEAAVQCRKVWEKITATYVVQKASESVQDWYSESFRASRAPTATEGNTQHASQNHGHARRAESAYEVS